MQIFPPKDYQEYLSLEKIKNDFYANKIQDNLKKSVFLSKDKLLKFENLPTEEEVKLINEYLLNYQNLYPEQFPDNKQNTTYLNDKDRFINSKWFFWVALIFIIIFTIAYIFN